MKIPIVPKISLLLKNCFLLNKQQLYINDIKSYSKTYVIILLWRRECFIKYIEKKEVNTQ